MLCRCRYSRRAHCSRTAWHPTLCADYEGRFHDQVMQDFADSYLRGETQSPASFLNQTVKFSDLLKTARDLGAGRDRPLCPAYRCGRKRRAASRCRSVEGPVLFPVCGDAGPARLFAFSQGNEQGRDRSLAHKYGLAVADKPDSQDICFVPNGRYGDVVRQLRPGLLRPGISYISMAQSLVSITA